MKDKIEVYFVKKGDPLLGGFSTGYANYKKGYLNQCLNFRGVN